MKASELKIGEQAKIIGVYGDNKTKKRIMELGLFPGQVITLKRKAPMGDPLDFECGEQQISIRKAEANDIEVEK